MSNDQITQTTIGPGIIITAIAIFVSVISVVITLLLFNMEEVRNKADKSEAADRWTRTMEEIKQACNNEKEVLRNERETLRDAASANALTALDWKSQYNDCITRWEHHLKVCKCKGVGDGNH